MGSAMSDTAVILLPEWMAGVAMMSNIMVCDWACVLCPLYEETLLNTD